MCSSDLYPTELRARAFRARIVTNPCISCDFDLSAGTADRDITRQSRLLVLGDLHGLCRQIASSLVPSATCEGGSGRGVKRNGPVWAHFVFLAEREGFEPSMEFLAPYSLSRGAPSANSAISPDQREHTHWQSRRKGSHQAEFSRAWIAGTSFPLPSFSRSRLIRS